MINNNDDDDDDDDNNDVPDIKSKIIFFNILKNQ